MRRSTSVAVLLAGTAVVASLLWLRANVRHLADARERGTAAIRTVVDTTRSDGWIDTFESNGPASLVDVDPRWRPLFGRMLVDPRRGAIGDSEGGWERDGGDDYAFRVSDVPLGDVAIVADGWWDGIGSFGVQGAVQAESPHRLYEAALWKGRLSLVYFIGPGPDKYEVLAESPELGVQAGDYRLVLCLARADSTWHITATVRDPGDGYRVLGRVSARDGRLGQGGQGIGLLGGGGPQSSFVRGIAVRGRSIPDPICD